MNLIQPRPLQPEPQPRCVLFAFAFRPFFLGVALTGLTLLPLWILILLGKVAPPGQWNPITWHAHEMVFGFAGAAVAGFLLTASANWTGLRTLHGPGLAALFALWVASRVAAWIPAVSSTAHAALDATWWLALTVAYLPPILKASNHRNLIFVPLLIALGVGDVWTHLPSLANGWQKGPHLGVFLLLGLISIIGGRVIPFFTSRVLPDAPPRKFSAVERIATPLTIAAAAAWLFAPPIPASAVLWAAAVVQLLRLSGWFSRGVLRIPLLWILYVAYLWMPIGFVLLGGRLWLGIPVGTALHALTAGTIATMILGLMSRVALGHTGRPLQVSRSTVWAYVLITLAALIRVTPAWGVSHAGLAVAGTCWFVAWLLIAIVYVPILLTPRADGRPG